MYVKIRRDGALGIGRATDGSAEITIGYGEAHMVAAALEKLAQTARNYKQVYHKTTGVGGGNKIQFERSEDGTIVISGDNQQYFMTEKEVRDLAKLLKNLPPVEVAPASDYVQKVTPQNDLCLVIMNGGQSAKIKITEAALIKTAVVSSVDSRFYVEHIDIGDRKISVNRSSDLKWSITVNETEIKFTAYEIEALIAGLQNGILDVLMDLVKSLGSDKISDIRIKSQIQRIEQETAKIVKDYKQAKNVVRQVVKTTKKILASKADADARTKDFIDLCNYIQAKVDRAYTDKLFELIDHEFIAK
ncbi:MAG: hypothetical protein ACTSYL_11555 [Candidatus Thorarchaeota archaeon]